MAETADDPDKTTQEEARVAEEAKQAAFRAGYDEEAPGTSPPVDAAATEAEPKETAEPPAELPAEGPKTVTLTEEDYKLLRSAAEEAPGLKQRLEQVFGTVGAVKDQIAQLRSQKGRVKISREASAKLAQEFPEIADILLPGLEAAEIESATAQPPAKAPAAVDPAALKEQVRLELVGEQKQRELARLTHLVPDWVKIVGANPSEPTPYRKWLAEQPEAYRTYIEKSHSAADTAASIRKFQGSLKPQPKPAPRDTDRTDRLRGAIPPKGSGAAPAPKMPTRQDAFREGYRTG